MIDTTVRAHRMLHVGEIDRNVLGTSGAAFLNSMCAIAQIQAQAGEEEGKIKGRDEGGQ